MKTNQEIFDACVTHVLKQSQQAHDGYTCVYFDPVTKLSCALGGPLVAAGLYGGCIEGASVRALRFSKNPPDANEIALKAKLEAWGVSPDQYELVGRIQGAHDLWDEGQPVDFVTAFTRKARKTAEDFNLNCDVMP